MNFNISIKHIALLCLFIININIAASAQLKLNTIAPDYPIGNISDVRWAVMKKISSHLDNLFIEYSNHLSGTNTTESHLSLENSFLLYKSNVLSVMKKSIVKSGIGVRDVNIFIKWWNHNGVYDQKLWLARCKSLGKKKVLLRRGSVSSAMSYYDCPLGTKLFE